MVLKVEVKKVQKGDQTSCVYPVDGVAEAKITLERN